MDKENGKKNFSDFRNAYETSPSKNSLPFILGAGGIIIIAIIAAIILFSRSTGVEEGSDGVSTKIALVETSVPTATLMSTATSLSTNTPISSPQPTVTNTPTSPPPTERPTSTPTQTPVSPTTTEASIVTATCLCTPQNAAFFSTPRESAQQIGVYTEKDEVVTVLGKDSNGRWLFVENTDGEQGWVSTSYFEISSSIDELEVVDIIVTRDGVTTLSPPTTDFPLIAYWNTGSKSGENDGTWSVILSVRVPRSGNYTFQVSNLQVDATLIENLSDGSSRYDVKVSGVSCSGPLVNNLNVFRNGTQLETRNEHTNKPGPVFVSKPDDDC